MTPAFALCATMLGLLVLSASGRDSRLLPGSNKVVKFLCGECRPGSFVLGMTPNNEYMIVYEVDLSGDYYERYFFDPKSLTRTEWYLLSQGPSHEILRRLVQIFGSGPFAPLRQ